MRWCVLLSLLALAVARKHFDGYKVVKVHPHGQEQVEFLRDLRHNDNEVDFWTEVPREGPVTIMVSMIKYVTLTTEFLRREIPFDVINENVEEQVQEEENRLLMKKAFDLNDFNTLADIESQMFTWAANCPAGLSCSRYPFGRPTAEDRRMYAFKMSSGSGRPAAWFDSTHHAREWISTATNLKIMNYFLTGYGSVPDATTILNDFDLYFVPVVNPDGYVYTWNSDRFWRKNRGPNPDTPCDGVDLNRNYPFLWGLEGVSLDPCSEIYRGANAGSEFEVQNMVDEISRVSSTQGMPFLTSYHSFGRMYMHPWGHTIDAAGVTCELAATHGDLNRMVNIVADAVEQEGGGQWFRGSSCEVVGYAISGGTTDWAHGAANVRYAFTPELRGPAFVVNPDQIEPSFQESISGVRAMFAAY